MDSTALRILQINTNHCARAQDLLIQSMAEWSINVAVVCEPYFIPRSTDWVGDADGLVTIIATRASGLSSPSNIVRGQGYVSAKINGVIFVGVYFSPNGPLIDFENLLLQLGNVVHRAHPSPVLILGDFNAKSPAWGSPSTNARGEALEEWSVELGMDILNRGTAHTCVRREGGSIVDISFASPDIAQHVQNWRVVEEVETLSDHRYIRFNVSAQTSDSPARAALEDSGPRWKLGRLDREALTEAVIVQSWIPAPSVVNIQQEAEWFQTALTTVCDAAMPRVRPQQGNPRRWVYWWSQDIAQLRHACDAARRQYTRHRRRRRRPPDSEAVETELYNAYRAAKTSLQEAIMRSKISAREELLASLDSDPWGRPYRMVRNKLRPWAPPLTRTLQPEFLETVILTLFPVGAESTTPLIPRQNADIEEAGSVPEVSQSELDVAILKMKAKSVAPGPDGIPGKMWTACLDLEHLGPRFRLFITACLQQGRFPKKWKSGKLVLIEKNGRPADSPSGFRPIVLLDEAGKLFERIIAKRIAEHLTQVGPDLDQNQFGFRCGRSTIDAVQRVKTMAEEAVSRGEVLVAVSLDIANAFNSLPWEYIKEALGHHNVPVYLRNIIGDYLFEREIIYPGRDGWREREITCGVPQGSVLGPLLWNITYDWVLRGTLLPGVSLTCYADDTLITARGKTHRAATILATAGVAQVVGRIRRLGLEVALHKSEAIVFRGPRNLPPPDSHIMVGGVRIPVLTALKYLGLILDSRWNFEAHFKSLLPKLLGTAAALSRLLPNLRGPDTSCRKLYTGIVRSMALYGSPVWAGNLNALNVARLRRAQRVIAVRMIRGYRTIGHEAAEILAGTAPWHLEAKALADFYHWRAEGRALQLEDVARRRTQLRAAVVQEWAEIIAHPSAGLSTIAAIRPVFKQWLERKHGALTYRMTQVLTGHGCFGRYLCRIGREETAECHHCSAQEDTALHTLQACPAWDAERRDLIAGTDVQALSLPAVVASMVESEGAWEAVASFCEAVMAVKEAAEREREAESLLPSRQRRPGRRRRAHNRDDLRPP